MRERIRRRMARKTRAKARWGRKVPWWERNPDPGPPLTFDMVLEAVKKADWDRA